MSDVTVENSGETNVVGNRASEESVNCEKPLAKDDKEKTCENGADTTPKPINRPSYIPPHLMGRDLNDPAQDMVGTGRRVQKPRLGVKVPYRNLTSQIVSQDEIAQEILERSLRKYSYSEVPEGGDVFFAMKLTHRLANKITPSVESSGEKASGSGDGIGSDAAKNSETAEASMKRNVTDVSAAGAEKSKESERINDANCSKKYSTTEKTCETSQEHVQDISKSDTCVNFESKADQLYAEISSTLGEDCKIGKTLKITPPIANSQAKIGSSRMANGSIGQTATETELDNDTLLAILEGTSDCHDVGTNGTASSPKVESPPQQPQKQQQQQHQSVPQPPQHQRKKRIKPMLDPSVEKELALKQLMDFETKKNEDRLKKSTAKKLKLDEETSAVNQNPSADTIGNSNDNRDSSIISIGGTSSSGVGAGDNDIVDAIQGCNASAASTDAIARQDTKTTVSDASKCESTPSGKKPKKSTFSGGSIAPKRFPKKYQRIIKRQLRSSKLKAKTTSPDQQLQKKLPEVPEVQIAIDRYIKTYASKRKRKPETEVNEKVDLAAANAATTDSPSKLGETIAAGATSPKDALATTMRQMSDSDRSAAAVVKDGDGRADDKMDVVTSSDADVGVDEEIKENESPATAKPKANSKVMREINRLLGDEGAINMIYSIEQKRLPDSKRDTNILPSLRRKKKDLLLKTKLVKNAVLRLSMSPGQLSPGRVRRTSPEVSTGAAQTVAVVAATSVKSNASPPRKASIESVDSNASEHSPKVRKVAAEASRIIRRHSSSSAYSSDEDESGAAKIVASSVTETAKNKPVDDKSGGGATVAAAAIVLSQTQPAAVEPKPANANNAKETNVRTGDNRTINGNNSGDIKNQNRVVQETKNNESDKSTLAENEEAAAGPSTAASSAIAAVTCPSKRKDSKESCAAAKTSNESPSVSFYSELVERLKLKEITLRKYDNLVQIILITSSCKMKNAMNIQVFNELTSVLGELQKDESCRTVLLTSTGSSFCQGVDLQALIRADISERRKIVDEYVAALSNFAESLSQFKKILIAGVHGSAVGLGVTMLPFFDMVFASDKATFYTPYVKLGQIPEAGATLTLPHLLGNAVTSELLFGCRMLTAVEALQFGLVTRILWPDKFGEELLPIARSVANNSSQSMEATKSLLRKTMNEKLRQQLNTEAELLREHWFGDECQRRFKDYLQQEALLQNK